MSFDYSKLRGRIAEKVGSHRELAKRLEISERTLHSKMTNQSAFTQRDIKELTDILQIEQEEIPQYFFTEKTQ